MIKISITYTPAGVSVPLLLSYPSFFKSENWPIFRTDIFYSVHHPFFNWNEFKKLQHKKWTSSSSKERNYSSSKPNFNILASEQDLIYHASYHSRFFDGTLTSLLLGFSALNMRYQSWKPPLISQRLDYKV